MPRSLSELRDIPLFTRNRRHRLPTCLPDHASFAADHLVALLTAKGLRKLGHVRERAVDAVASVGMRVAKHLRAVSLGCVLTRPDLGIAEEETLGGRKAVDLVRVLAGK